MSDKTYWSGAIVASISRRRALATAGAAAAGGAFLAACGGGSSSSGGASKPQASSLIAPVSDTSKQAKRGGLNSSMSWG